MFMSVHFQRVSFSERNVQFCSIEETSPPRSNVRVFPILSHVTSNSRHILILVIPSGISSTIPLFPNIDYSCWPNTLTPFFWYYFDFGTGMVSKNMFESMFCGWSMISSPWIGRLSISAANSVRSFDVLHRLN